MNSNITTKLSTEQEATPFGNVLLPAVLLFLDDYRMPIDCASYMYRKNVDCRIYHKEWNIVRSYWQFTKWIEQNGLPDFISFDHDLADVVELKEELPIEQWFDLENNKEFAVDIPRFSLDIPQILSVLN